MVVVEEDKTRKRRKKVTSKAISRPSDMWLLQAKKWTNDTRDIDVTESLQVYLLPDRPVTIGKNKKMCDMVVPGDRTVSGKHATVCVQRDEDGSHVEVRDCSRLGTVVTKTNDFKMGRFTGEAVVAHDSWYILFGHMSPFQVKRVHISIHFNKDVLEEMDGVSIARKTGIPVVEELSAVKGMHLVVGPESCHAVDEKILLAAVLNIPVVRLEWLKAWSSQLWIGEGPHKHNYGVTLVHEDKTLAEPIVTQDAQIVYRCNFMHSETAEKAEVLSCTFVWPWGSLSKELQEAMSIVGIHLVETSMDECFRVCEGLEKPVIIIQSMDSQVACELPISVVFFCFLSDLMALIFDGNVSRLLRSLSELRGSRGRDQCTMVAPDQDGWHTVCRNGSRDPPEQVGGDHISDDEGPDDNKESSVILVTSGRKSFVKKHAPSKQREIIPLVQSNVPQQAPAFEEWAEQERYRMAQKVKDDAFDMQGVKKSQQKGTRIRKQAGGSRKK